MSLDGNGEWQEISEDFYIKVLDDTDCLIHIESTAPKPLVKGETIFLKRNTWCRIIKGSKDLSIEHFFYKY